MKTKKSLFVVGLVLLCAAVVLMLVGIAQGGINLLWKIGLGCLLVSLVIQVIAKIKK
ncbi:MAG: hypothetical protein IK138_06410 [Lachnospiraceae bacterium]|nr:hypothetical protein [Lachnospiraceae bacterium]